MYPMEYRWIMVEIPVMNSTMVMDSGSTNSRAWTCRESTGIHVHRFWV